MANAAELNLDIDEIRERLEIGKNKTISFPEMICQKIHETNISKWIASLLDPNQNKYAIQILNILLKKAERSECMSGDICVNTESVLGIENRIDIYITTPKYIIGIEVKIGATETGGDQTERYHEVIKRRCQRDQKDPVEIYLKPSSNTNKHKCPDFIDITFKDILPELHGLSKNLPIDRDHFILDEFISYIENGPEKARFLSLLSKEQESELKKYHDTLYENMSQYLTDHKYIMIKKGLFKKDGLGFMQLQREGAADWGNISFHYEILWTESHYLALNKKVGVAVHLEIYSKKKRKELANFFKTTKDDGTTLFYKEIDVDFTSKEKSRETMDRIIAILDSEEVVQLGNIADECVKKNNCKSS